MNTLLKINVLFVAAVTLTACSMNAQKTTMTTTASTDISSMTTTGEPTQVSTGSVGGKIQLAMDDNDKQKLSRAMDSGIGKETKWVNGGTGISYTVVPTKKVTIGSNKFCRQYKVTMQRQDNKQNVNGTACIADDGNWHPA